MRTASDAGSLPDQPLPDGRGTPKGMGKSAAPNSELRRILRRIGGRRNKMSGKSSPTLRSLEAITDPALAFLPLDQLLEAVLDRTLAAVHGDVVSILLMTRDRESLYLRICRGDENLAPDSCALSSEDGVLASTARWTRPVVIDDVPATGIRPTSKAQNVASLMAAPLMVRGTTIGVIEVGTKEPHHFESMEVRVLQVVADRCAVTIEQARLAESERRSRLGADHARLHLDILARTGTVLAQALESYEPTLEELGQVLVPDFADSFAVDVLEPSGALRRVTTTALGRSSGGVAHNHPEGDHLVRLAISERRPQVVIKAARTRSNGIDASFHQFADCTRGSTNIDSMLVVPIKVRDDVFGVISFVTGPGRRGYRPSDLKTAREIADRVGVAIERVAAWQEGELAGRAALGYAQRLRQLVEAGLVVNAQLAEEEVLELLAEHAHRVLAADQVVIIAQPGGGQLLEKVWPPRATRDIWERDGEAWAPVSAASNEVALSGLACHGPRDDEAPASTNQGDGTRSSAALNAPKSSTVSWIAVPITSHDGECTRVAVALRDSGERFGTDDESVLTLLAQMASVALQNAQLYADVRSNERRLQAVLESSPLAIAELDPSGDARWWNRAAGELFGWGATEGPRRVTVREGSELVLAELWERARDGKPTTGVALPSSGPNGEQLELSVSTSPLSEQGMVTGMLLVADDVTEWRRILDQFHQAERLGAMARMAGAVAHDFNNLLTVILGCSEILMQRIEGDDSLVQEVSAIQRAGTRAAALTNQLVGIGQQRPVQPEVIDVEEVVDSMRSMISGVLGEGVTLHVVRSAGATRILIDRSELERSILNLAINARDAMPNGGRFVIQTGWTAESVNEASKSVQISFADTGTGIEPDVLAHCFEPFFTTKGRAHGTGLGLSTVHATVTKAGGEIRVDSTPGQGTKFTMVFPAHEAGVLSTAPQPSDAVLPTPALPGEKVVLFVDDDSEVLRLAVRELERRGYKMIGAANGSQALSEVSARNGEIDLLVTDVVMPGMSGIELADAVFRRYPHIPVLFISGHLDEQVAGRHPLPSGAQLLPKPFTPDELVLWVVQVLSRHGAPRTRRPRKGVARNGSSAPYAVRRVS